MANHSHKKAKAPSPTVADVDAHASVTVTETAAPKPAPAPAPSKKNPLVGMSDADLEADIDGFLARYELQAFETAFRKGALLARAEAEGKSMTATTTMMARYEHQQLSDAESEALVAEHKKPMRSIPSTMWLLCALCAGCAIVQGMDQTVINGAQEFYFAEFGITDSLMKGFINGSPYVAASTLGCLINPSLNARIGRRGTICVSCVIAFITAIWQAASPSWPCLLAARLALGLAVGAKSSTTPVFAAESSPTALRGALTMLWQVFTAFGIMLGFAASLALQHADFMGPNSQWRWMIGVTALPPLLVAVAVYFLPESPRWYMSKGRYVCAWDSIRRLRRTECQAARDLYMASKLLAVETKGDADDAAVMSKFQRWRKMCREFVTVRRNWRAAQSAYFCMFMQQFCGVNVLAYYSTSIFSDAGFSRSAALAVSLGCGIVNFIGAAPALWAIDRKGRRTLLLTTFPLLAFFLALASLTFHLIPEGTDARLGLVGTSLYLFMAAYSPGMGPVPFTYSAEAFPLRLRSQGMASAVSVTWAFNFLISFTWPAMSEAMTPSGGLAWYAGWNIFGWVFAYFLLPETKGRSLEELDIVFSVRNRDHAAFYTRKLGNKFRRLLGMDIEPLKPLYSDGLELNTVPTADNDDNNEAATVLGEEVKDDDGIASRARPPTRPSLFWDPPQA